MPSDHLASRGPQIQQAQQAQQAQRFHLKPGQSLRVHAVAGTVLHVNSGSLWLAAAPAWLAGTLFRHERRLAAGDVFVVESAGWLALQPDGESAVTLRPPLACRGEGRARLRARLATRFQAWRLAVRAVLGLSRRACSGRGGRAEEEAGAESR